MTTVKDGGAWESTAERWSPTRSRLSIHFQGAARAGAATALGSKRQSKGPQRGQAYPHNPIRFQAASGLPARPRTQLALVRWRAEWRSSSDFMRRSVIAVAVCLAGHNDSGGAAIIAMTMRQIIARIPIGTAAGPSVQKKGSFTLLAGCVTQAHAPSLRAEGASGFVSTLLIDRLEKLRSDIARMGRRERRAFDRRCRPLRPSNAVVSSAGD